MNYDQFIEELDERLQQIKCIIWRKPQFPSKDVALYATRIEWDILRTPIHLCVDYLHNPKPGDFLEFFEESLMYSKRAFSGTRGIKVWLSVFAIVPCFVCDVADPQTIEFVRKRHFMWRRHLKHLQDGFVFYPVLHCLRTNETYYWEGYRGLQIFEGAMWPATRRFISEAFVPAAGPTKVIDSIDFPRLT
jgi:hypothetical protein